MDVTLRVRVDGPGLSSVPKQAAFAMALTINRTLDETQAAVRARIRQRFTIRPRGASFIYRLVKRRREDFADRKRLTGRLRIEGPESDLARAKILSRHEEGGSRTTGAGGYSIDPSFRLKGFFFVPTDQLRAPFSAEVLRAMYPANLRLTERRAIEGGTTAPNVHHTAAGKLQLKGKRRTFVLLSAGSGRPLGVYQRGDGSGGRTSRHDIKLIWRFDPQITLRPRLQFFDTGREMIRTRVPVNLPGFLRYALRTAK
jgi:hypothetical protein